MSKRLPILFFLALFLNVLWEEAHSALYISYQGGEITNLILFRAAAFDAAVITLLACPFFLWESNSYSRSRSLTSATLFTGLLILFAVFLEKWALGSGRWMYTDAMPLLPFLHVGLTPAIQLGITGYLSITVSKRFSRQS